MVYVQSPLAALPVGALHVHLRSADIMAPMPGLVAGIPTSLMEAALSPVSRLSHHTLSLALASALHPLPVISPLPLVPLAH